MQHIARFDRSSLEIGAILIVGGNRLTVGDILVVDGIDKARITALGLGRLVIEVGGVVFELRPWHRGDGEAPVLDGPGSTWTVSGMPNHTRTAS